MPPACRFTREQIVAAALAITRERGFDAVTARAIADTLHSSSKVIFSAFSGMDDLLAATIDAADAQYRAYSADFVRDSADPPYKAVGTAYIRFARNEPNLFHLLYMRDRRREDHSGDAENIERAENEVKQVGNVDAIPASLIANFDYAALGHIHKPMKVGSETLRYCGTPMPYSLSEENQQKGILMVEMGAKGDVQTTVLPLHPVHQVRKLRATREALLSGASEDFVSICVIGAEATEMVGLRELLRAKYPNLLELRREEKETVELAALQERTETLSPYELCLQFAGERLNAEEKALLTEVMNAMKEENA